ncbi:MAG: ThuA domain-containing protein [Prevotella sp.]|nr:ThuA domain-containing protein [Prevotella sp.]
MNKTRIILSMAVVMLMTATLQARPAKADNMVVVAYVTSWTQETPDPSVMTHINYAFGHVNDSFDGVRIDNPERLRKIVGLKEKNSNLKVMLSIGGWGSGRFSEMAASEKNRASFVNDCRRVVSDFKLDGIDIDWEYPTQSSAGISSSPDDTGNFTLLMRDLRRALGKKKLLTAATVCDAKYIDFRSCIQYMDFVNVMAYDMGNPPRHHAALFPSAVSSHITASQAVEEHLKAGVPANKLVMGMPFYGRGSREDSGLREYDRTGILPKGYEKRWDDVGKVPYITNEQGILVRGYENSQSLAEKCQFILDHHLRGGMYWDYASDNSQGDERTTLYLSLLKNKKATLPPRKVLVLAERGGLHEPFTATGLQWLEDNKERFNMQLVVLNTAENIAKGELGNYHLVLQLNHPPYAWSKEAQLDFQNYINRGVGNYIGFHHATLLGEFDGYGMWQWFSDFMGGMRYENYIAEKCDGTVQVEDRQHPVMNDIPGTFVIEDDEWYTYNKNPRQNVHVLAHVDEASYTIKTNIKMGDHPVVWTNPSKGARNVYFQFGHSKLLFDNPIFVKLLENALKWTLMEE